MSAYAPPARLEVTNLNSLVVAIQHNLGAGIFTQEALVIYPEIEELDFGLPAPASFELWLLVHRTLRVVPRVRVVMDFIQDLAKEFFEQGK